MKQLKMIMPIFIGALLGFFIGFFTKPTQTDVVGKKIQEVVSNNPADFSVTKGGVYTKKIGANDYDPFAKITVDTLTVVDLAQSPRNSDVYVKWRLNSWKDTNQYISTELSFFVKDLKKIR